MIEMTKEQAVAELQMALAALFPYLRPEDDPDRERARAQERTTAALTVLAQSDTAGMMQSLMTEMPAPETAEVAFRRIAGRKLIARGHQEHQVEPMLDELLRSAKMAEFTRFVWDSYNRLSHTTNRPYVINAAQRMLGVLRNYQPADDIDVETAIELFEDLIRRGETGAETPMANPGPIQVWRFADAPEYLRRLSPHGGDEDWLAVVPAALADRYIGWLESGAFDAGGDPSHHLRADGSVVVIGAH